MFDCVAADTHLTWGFPLHMPPVSTSVQLKHAQLISLSSLAGDITQATTGVDGNALPSQVTLCREHSDLFRSALAVGGVVLVCLAIGVLASLMRKQRLKYQPVPSKDKHELEFSVVEEGLR